MKPEDMQPEDMKPEDLQPNDVVLVERDGLRFATWVVNQMDRHGFIYLRHGILGKITRKMHSHSIELSHITFIARPANEAERNLYINLGS